MPDTLFSLLHSKKSIIVLTMAVSLIATGCQSSKSDQAASAPPKSPLLKPVTKPSTSTTSPQAPQQEKIVFKRPALVRGFYLTAWSAGSPRLLSRFMHLADTTELNSVVIDVRDTGENYFPMKNRLSDEVEGKQFLAVVKPQAMMRTLAEHHVWPIARVACFRDNLLPRKHPERAVQLASGRPWRDRSGHMWLDPYNRKNWEYLAQVVDYAMDAGFPEIQLDYVRFPSEGKSRTQVFPSRKSYPDAKAKPEDVIARFAEYLRKRVKDRGCGYSADIFGIISSTKGDEGIGQELEKVAAPFDLVSPMVYPSHFAHGEYGIPDPNRAPYEIVKKSLTDYKKRIPHKGVRPWLQDFSLFHVKYGVAQVKAQIRAANELGYKEFLLWNASNHYTAAAVPKGGDKSDVTLHADPNADSLVGTDRAVSGSKDQSHSAGKNHPATTKPAENK